MNADKGGGRGQKRPLISAATRRHVLSPLLVVEETLAKAESGVAKTSFFDSSQLFLQTITVDVQYTYSIRTVHATLYV